MEEGEVSKSGFYRRRLESDLEVYVGGIPSYTSKDNILTYFSTFGRIEKVKLFFRSKVHSNSKSNLSNQAKGYCVVKALDHQTVNNILNIKNHFFEGRYIICSLYKTGDELAKENTEKNEKRVIIKKVPASIPELSVNLLLEKLAGGKVEVMYPFISDFQKKDVILNSEGQTEKRFKAYSVMFSDKESAERIIRIRCYQLKDGSTIFIEKYQNKREVINQKGMTKYSNEIIGKKEKKEGIEHFGHQDDSIIWRSSLNLENRSKNEKTQSMKKKKKKKFIQISPNLFKYDKKFLFSNRPPEEIEDLIPHPQYHYQKPTSRIYFTNRDELKDESFPYRHLYNNIRMCICNQ